MKNKLIPAVLVAAMTVTILAGCGTSQKSSTDDGNKDQKKVTLENVTTQLSNPDFDFEKEYAFGDFNAHSRADMERQGGIDTFEDKEIVFQDISYDQLINLLNKEGNFLIQLSGSWCHNSRALSPSVNEFAKENGIDTIYSYDFNVDNGDDGSMFVRMSNEKTTLGTKYNYMYGEFVSRYLTNLDDWIAYPKDDDTALSYTNAEGKEVTVGRLQQPIIFLYNKDNTVDNSGSGNTSGKCPIVYAFEEMVERDSEGIYVKETDEEGNPVLDEEGNPVRKYITDEYRERLNKLFDFIKTNQIELSHYTKESYMRDAFNSYGKEIFKADEQINVYPVTYRQLEWLLDEDGNALVLMGGPGSEKTRAVIGEINDYAVKNNIRVYMYDPQIDGGITVDKWGYKQTTNICEEDSPIIKMYTNLIDRHLTNLTAVKTTEDGYALIQTPYLFAYNKDAKDADGFIAPITASAELPYTADPEKRYYIGTEKNAKACAGQISAVFLSYAENSGIELQE